MSVALKNVSKGIQIFDLSHDHACEGDEDGCLCTDHTLRVPTLNPESGENVVRLVDKTISDSVHIAVGETSRDLPERVLNVPGIKRAIAAKQLVVVESEKAATPEKVESDEAESEHEAA